MSDAPPQFVQKLSRVWSSRKEREVYILVEYCKWQEQGCEMFCLSRLQDLR